MDGNKATLVSAGFTTSITLEAAKTLEEEGIEVDMINMASIKPIDSKMIIESAKKTGLVITVEDHNIIGGLGSAVCEVLSENYPVRVIRMGVRDKFGSSGSPSELIKAYGFDKDSIVKTVKENINYN
jgi:transketolase